MIDFHCHLDLYRLPTEIAGEAQRRGVGLLSVTTTPSAWRGTSRLAEGRSVIRTALGLHPQLARERKAELRQFDQHFSETRFVGEVGLDGASENRAHWDDQVAVFEHVLQACNDAETRIVSIHSRRAVDPVLDMLDRYSDVSVPLLHWFSGTHTQLRRAIDRGCWFSVGPAMLMGAKGRALVSEMPENRVVVETDGPFTQVQGTALSPWDVVRTRPALTEVWGISGDDVDDRVRGNELVLLGALKA